MSIVVNHLSYTYKPGTVFQRRALKDVSLKVATGEFVGILGASGSGKSTFLQHLNGAISSQEKVTVAGLSLGAKGVSLLQIVAAAALAFQYPEQQLFCDTVFQEVAFACSNLGFSAEKKQRLCEEYLEKLGFNPSFYHRSPFELSGGEKRRLALAAIFAMDTPVLLLDEPTVGLDIEGKKIVAALIRDLHRQGKTILWVSHDLAEISALAERLLVFADGSIVMDGSVKQIVGQREALKRYGIMGSEAAALQRGLEEKFGAKLRTEEGAKFLAYLHNAMAAGGEKR